MVVLQHGAQHPQASFQIYRISGQDPVLKGNESLTRVKVHVPSAAQGLLGRNIVAARCVHSWLVTASCLDEGSGSDATARYGLQVWGNVQGEDSQPPSVLQTVTVELPRFQSKISSSALRNPLLECALHVEQRGGRYLIFSSRYARHRAML